MFGFPGRALAHPRGNRIGAGLRLPPSPLPCGKAGRWDCVKLSEVAVLLGTWHQPCWNAMPLVFSKGSFLRGCEHRSAATVCTQPGSKWSRTFKAAFSPRDFPRSLHAGSFLLGCQTEHCAPVIRSELGSLPHSREASLRHLSLKLHQTLGRTRNV